LAAFFVLQKLMKKKHFILLFILITIGKFCILNADPSWLKSLNDAHDEVWWADNARLKILFNEWQMDVFSGARAVSPVGTCLFFLSFKLFGINFFSLRIFSFLAGVGSALIFLRILKKFNANYSYEKTLVFFIGSTLSIWSALGQWEATLSLLFLIGIHWVLGKQSIENSILISVILSLGILIKPTFVYYAIPLLGFYFYNHNFKTTLKKPLILFSLVLPSIIILLAFQLVYFNPNYNVFAPYYNQFSSIYYSAFDLINPSFWLIKISGIFDNEWFLYPDIAILLVFTMLQEKSNKNKSIYLLLGLCFLSLLFSDFNSRRFIMLTPLLYLIVMTTDVKIKNVFNSNTAKTNIILSIFLIAVVGFYIKNNMVLIALAVLLIIYIYYLELYQKSNFYINLILISISAVSILFFSVQYAFNQFTHYSNYSQNFTQLSILILSILIYILALKLSKSYLKIVFVLNTLILIITILNLDYSIQKTNYSVAEMVEGPVIGDLVTMESLFLSKSYVLHYPTEDVKNELRTLQLNKKPHFLLLSNYKDFKPSEKPHSVFEHLIFDDLEKINTKELALFNSKIEISVFKFSSVAPK
jgi:4-amino-4-deoxy-L-arabinose transferase-like glycosyltransferase